MKFVNSSDLVNNLCVVVCVFTAGHDEAVDVSADVGRPSAHAVCAQTAAPVDRQATLLPHHSRPRQLCAHPQHTSRRGGPRTLQVDLTGRHEGWSCLIES